MNQTRDADPDNSREYDFAHGERAKYLDLARRGLRLPAPRDGRPPTSPAAEDRPKPGPTKR